MKKRILVGAGALLVAAAPAALGLWGNASFAESVPVPVPSLAQVLAPTPSPSASVDDHGGDVPRDQRVEPGDDRDGGSLGADDGGAVTRPDDAGGDAPRDTRVEPGDDRAVQGGRDSTRPSTDDSGRTDDRRSDDGGTSGRGGDRHGGDD
ncbi:hypothetical protein [uncultured Microbacterium sp.]|uniref:hypothetical protein n=1 Tax=uncultured Microbacterium sp. TaxID=191216 RepID=UPI0025CFA4E6|nr:hypothetical protein [uncultured Microbacterium sp.]